MPLSPLREQLIERVKEGKGRDEYRRLMEAIPAWVDGVPGRLGEHICLRIIKGTQRLKLKRALLTRDGLSTEDGQVVDCGAALVKIEPGLHNGQPYDVKRYAGKETGNVHRISAAYEPSTGAFTLGTDGTGEQSFDIDLLQPKEGPIVTAKMGDSILQGVLLNQKGPLTEHIRDCLAPFDRDAGKIAVLVRHPSFKRVSDTVDDGNDEIRTAFTDGSQLHIINAASSQYENQFLPAPVPIDASRPGLTIEGMEMLPFIEDVIGSIRVRCADGTFARICFADLTPRCKDAQQDPLTGELTPQGNAAKSWRIEHRPRILVTEKKVPNHTAGANAHVDPLSFGKEQGRLITGGAKFVIESEKIRLPR